METNYGWYKVVLGLWLSAFPAKLGKVVIYLFFEHLRLECVNFRCV